MAKDALTVENLRDEEDKLAEDASEAKTDGANVNTDSDQEGQSGNTDEDLIGAGGSVSTGNGTAPDALDRSTSPEVRDNLADKQDFEPTRDLGPPTIPSLLQTYFSSCLANF